MAFRSLTKAAARTSDYRLSDSRSLQRISGAKCRRCSRKCLGHSTVTPLRQWLGLNRRPRPTMRPSRRWCCGMRLRVIRSPAALSNGRLRRSAIYSACSRARELIGCRWLAGCRRPLRPGCIPLCAAASNLRTTMQSLERCWWRGAALPSAKRRVEPNRFRSSAFQTREENGFARMATEEVDPRFADLDAWSLASAMEAMWEGQLAAVAAIGRALPAITAATNAAREALGDHGRLIYVGAGTSGRVAVQDGAELTPTFAWPQERLLFIIAGGESAFVASVEGAEDDVIDAVKQIDAARLSQNDVVIAVSASGTTPFTEAALREAGAHRAVTIGVANNPGTALLASAKYPVLVETGRELIAGSTRMKAGTAQKVVLNLISSGI